MRKKIGIVLVGLAVLTLGAAACSQAGPQLVRPTWVQARVADSTASIPLGEVEGNAIVHFKVGTPNGAMTFMAYRLQDRLQVRASICPPCRSESFSIQGDRLICNTCQTVFDARTGKGLDGACVAFPKESVPYETSGKDIIMRDNDLVKAYLDTLTPG